MLGIAGLVAVAAAGPIDGPSHTFGLRYRHGSVPNVILNSYYFADSQGYTRPKVGANVFGLEYTLGLPGSANFTFWAERISVPLDPGYWDDKEKPPEPISNDDGDWIEADGLGADVIGANYAYDIPIVDTDAPVRVSLGIGGGIGVGPTTGAARKWHPGYNPENVDPTCLPTSLAPDRAQSCPSDGEINVPKVAPVVDLSLSPKVVIAEHVMVRIDLGVHDFLYWGLAAGGQL
jgi:hypothetical protein